MKKRFFILTIFSLLTITILIIYTNNRNLCKSIDTTFLNTYIPDGIANSYSDIMFFGFDDYRIWSYNLNQSEIDIISEELDNKIWKLASEDDYYEIISVFFKSGNENYLKSELTKDIYYCIFDPKNNHYVDLHSDKFGHWIIFIYDETLKTFWCVSKSIWGLIDCIQNFKNGIKIWTSPVKMDKRKTIMRDCRKTKKSVSDSLFCSLDKKQIIDKYLCFWYIKYFKY